MWMQARGLLRAQAWRPPQKCHGRGALIGEDVLGDRCVDGEGDGWMEIDCSEGGRDKRQASRAARVGRVRVPRAGRVTARPIAAPHGRAGLVQAFDGGLVDGTKDDRRHV